MKEIRETNHAAQIIIFGLKAEITSFEAQLVGK
jgi:hypothetical protein